MNTKYLLTLVLCLGMLGLAQAQTKKKYRKKDMVSLSVLKGNAELKVGQKAYYTATVHGSVGITASVRSDDSRIINLIDSRHAYDKPQRSGMSGGDRGTRTFIFEALKAGKTNIEVKEMFRGDVKQTYTIEVVVTDK